MPKHISENPRTQEVYDIIRHIDGVQDIDGRSSGMGYIANVKTLTEIIEALIEVYGPPTDMHPLVNDIRWEIEPGVSAGGVTKIYINKADSIDGTETIHSINAYNF